MRLSELLQGVEIKKSNSDLNTYICKIASDSRKIRNNYVFVAINGETRNGNDYIENAKSNGAVVIITDDELSYGKHKSCVLVGNARFALAKMWSNYYGNPSKNIKTIAITGTNGKTSSAYYLYNVLKAANKKRGLISTVECLINDKKLDINGGTEVTDIYSAMTTPDPEILYSIYNLMKENGVEYVVIEASSHSLSQERLAGLEIEISAFTNLSREHLDYHKTMKAYFESKKKLFEKGSRCVVNIDDKYGKIIYEKFKDKSLGFSIKEKTDFLAQKIENTMYGNKFYVNELNIETKNCGIYNVYNSLLAISVAKLLNIEDAFIKKGILKTTTPGRLERYYDKNIFIDYAHTPLAMESVLSNVRAMMPQKRLVVLFGCGGDRDKGKRREMGCISSKYADTVIITSDNSRNENPNEIIKEIINGVSIDFVVIRDRKEAIKYIASRITENDVLLLLGKGHEDYEIDEKGKHFFSEKRILDEVFNATE